MVFLLSGTDGFRLRLALRQIVDRIRAKHGRALAESWHSHPDLSFDRVGEALRGSALFSSHTLLVCENLFSDADFCASLADSRSLLEREDISFVAVHEGNLPSKSALASFVSEKGKVFEFAPLRGSQRKEWVLKQLADLNARAEEAAVDLIASRVEKDSGGAANAISQLAAFCVGRAVTREDVERFFPSRDPANIFLALEGMMSRDRARALASLIRQLESGDNALGVISMLAYQVRLLIEAKEAQQAQRPLPQGFAYKKAASMARKFSFGELRGLHGALYELDRAAKTGGVKGEDALKNLVLGLFGAR